jgi:hypothetical protein
MINNIFEEQRDYEQREAISSFLAAALRQIFNVQIAPGTRTLRNLPIPSSLIKIDLASLGINSLNTTLNTSALFEEQNEVYIPNGMEIVPWKPTGAALALQVFAASTRHQGAEIQEQRDSHHNSDLTPVQGFEFEAQSPRPSLIMYVYKRRPRPRRDNMGLPTASSVRDPSTPVVDKTSRRSTRLQAAKAGFSYRLDKNPTKRCKITALQISNADGEAGPVPIATLQSWGVDCGVDPGDLTEEALMQTPAEHHQP